MSEFQRRIPKQPLHVYHKGYRVDVLALRGDRVTADNNVRVYANSCFLYALYWTDTIDKALRWIDGYIAGEAWAVNSQLRWRVYGETYDPPRRSAAR